MSKNDTLAAYSDFTKWCRDNPNLDLDSRPHSHGGPIGDGGYISDEKTRVAFAAWRAAIEADRKRRGEPVSEETLWCLHILGPDDVHPAPSRAYAEVAADLHNTRFGKISKESGVMCEAVVAPWPHDSASHARGLVNFVSNWIAPQPAEPVKILGRIEGEGE